MKNHKPLQFVKECPNYAELWKIIDETITKPMEGLSVEELKYHLYLFIRVGNFKETKKVLQTSMESKDIIFVKNHVHSISMYRTIKYLELLPKVEGLPDELVKFLYCTYVNSEVLPKLTAAKMIRILDKLDSSIPNLTTLKHSESIADISSKYDLELAVYKALIDDTAIPTFKLVAKDTEPNTDGWITWEGGECPVNSGTEVEVKLENDNTVKGIAESFIWEHGARSTTNIIAYRVIEGYPRYFKDPDGCIVKFTNLTIGKVVEQGLSAYFVKDEEEDWVPHTDNNIWTELPDYKEV